MAKSRGIKADCVSQFEAMLSGGSPHEWNHSNMMENAHSGKEIMGLIDTITRNYTTGIDPFIDKVISFGINVGNRVLVKHGYYRLYLSCDEQKIMSLRVHSSSIDKLARMISTFGKPSEIDGTADSVRFYTGKEIKEAVAEISAPGTVYWDGYLDADDIADFKSNYITGEHPISDTQKYYLFFGGFRGTNLICKKQWNA